MNLLRLETYDPDGQLTIDWMHGDQVVRAMESFHGAIADGCVAELYLHEQVGLAELAELVNGAVDERPTGELIATSLALACEPEGEVKIAIEVPV